MKKFLWILALLLVLLILLFAFIPTWLSTESGSQRVVGWINRSIPGEITVGKTDFNWIGSQQIEGFTYIDEKGKKIASFDLLETNTSLLYFLFGGRNFKETTLVSPYLYIEHTEEKEAKKTKKEGLFSRFKKDKQLPTYSERFYISDGTIVYDAPQITPITLSEINIDGKVNPTRLTVSAKTQQGEIIGSLDATATITDSAHLDVNLHDFPVELLDQLEGATLFTDALGRRLNAHFHLEKDVDAILVEGKIEAANLTGSIQGVTEGDRLVLTPGTKLVFTLTPTFFQNWAANEDWSLVSNTEVTINIDQGSFPLKLQKPDFSDIILKGTAKIDRAEINHKEVGSYSLNQFDVSIIARENIEVSYEGQIQGKEATKLSGTISISPKRDLLFSYTYEGFPVTLIEIISPSAARNLRTLFGTRFDLKGEGILRDNKLKSSFSLEGVDIALQGQIKGTLPRLHFEAEGTRTFTGEAKTYLGESADFTLEGKLNLKERKAVIPTFEGKIANDAFALEFTGRMKDTDASFAYEQLSLDAKGTIHEPHAVAGDYMKEAKVILSLDGPKNRVKGTVETDDLKGSFEIENLVEKGAIAFDKSRSAFKLKATKFPLELLDPLQPEGINLVALLGPQATIELEGSYAPSEEQMGEIDLNIHAEGFKAQFSVSIGETLTIEEEKPSFIFWEMTPHRFQSLIQAFSEKEHESTFILTRTVPVKIDISQFSCPSLSPKEASRFLCKTGFVGKLEIGKMVFKGRETHEPFVIERITGSIEGINFSEEIDLHLDGSFLATNVPKSEHSGFTFNGRLLNFWGPEGRFNRKGLTLHGEVDIDLLPIRQFVGIVPMAEEARKTFEAVLGDLVNARISGEISQLNGPITIDINSSNFKSIIPLQLTPEALYLREQVNAQISLTHAVNETFLKDVNPLLITGAYADHPITVSIDPQGFVIPLHPFTFRQIKIPHAVIDIGKIWVVNGGDIQELMAFLKSENVTPDGQMEAWFTPIYLGLEGGVTTYQRFDALLAHSAHIALWGKIDWNKDKVKMTLGISPQTLQQRFKVSGLAKGDLFQVKMRGSVNDLQLDWSSASARIGILIARSTGGIGNLVGGLVEPFVQLGEKPAPPPTTQPFPWQQ